MHRVGVWHWGRREQNPGDTRLRYQRVAPDVGAGQLNSPRLDAETVVDSEIEGIEQPGGDFQDLVVGLGQ